MTLFSDNMLLLLDYHPHSNGDCRGGDRMVVKYATTVQSMYNNTKVVSSNLVHGEVNSIQYYVIKFVS